MELSIECQKREAGAKPKALRRAGLLPAVLYGHDGAESISLTVNEREAERLVKSASINNTLVNVDIPELPWKGKALLREVQTHPWKSQLYHISFFSIASQDTIEVVVPMNYQGIPQGVKEEGATLDVLVSELAISCEPESIPETIDVDVSALGVGENLHISDLKLPAGLSVVTDTDKTLVTIFARRAAETDAAAAETETTVITEV